ncbi:polysaccharide pyruvyl transferase family protein [Pseudoxanthomonas sp. SGNA-20]|uniref:polysaccharide pyruvyl transferase family protein n=1 Tax=Pseudoxanthomonas sp. SGNA-20 TaxID=2493088 RepID=UPI000F63A885|nr:polysaccharide pyruvyl transferase family protein [Pseudoxanthomonas sp. SGNA-20]RRN53993.1 polysaccharide pyruvyl transferase family protein [Pseudoxanthomonas sp. SGNA-20]
MRVGILTFQFSDNFGALLQAYALRRWFTDRGHDAEFIAYHPTHVEEGGSLRLSLSPAAFKSNAKTLYLKSTAFLHQHFGNKDQARRFARFRQEQLGITGSPLRERQELVEAAGHYDLIVAGSDQIWSPSVQYGFDPAYFLEFAKDARVRRISYAASFGRDTLGADQITALGPLLRPLSSISVRELSGVDIVRQASGRDAACVPDPTLLHEQYDQLLAGASSGQEGHVFCYALRTAEVIREVAEGAARMTGTPILSPYNVHRRWREIGQTVHPGPAEWVSHLANASFVVTNSFHGTVFSILFRKPFLVAELPGSRVAMNARSRNLLSQLDLMDRFVRKEDLPRLDELLARPIDWDAVEAKQQGLREVGSSFLAHEVAQVENG